MFIFRVEVFWQDCQNFILHLQSNIWIEKYCLKEIYRFVVFLRASGEKFAAILSKLQCSIPEDYFWRKLLFEKNNGFIDVFRASEGKFPARLSKLHSNLPEDQCGGNFFEETTVLSFLRASVEDFSEWLSKSPSDFPYEHFAISVCLRELTFSIFFLSSGEKFFGRFVKSALYIFRRKFKEKIFVRKKLQVYSFFSGFGGKSFGRIVDITLYFSRGTFWVTTFVLKKIISCWLILDFG